jgi:anti-sigma factor RsiW
VSEICESLHAFADGELPAEEAEVFLGHLGTCSRCQAELHDVLQLQGMTAALGGAAAPVRSTRRWHTQPARIAAVVLPLAAAVLLFVFLRPPREAVLPAYVMKGPFGQVEGARGSTTAAALVFVPESVLEVQLLPAAEVAIGGAPPAAALFVAEPGGPVARVAGVDVRATDQGAFALRAGGRAVFGDHPGEKTIYAVVAPSARALESLAGADPRTLAERPELRVSSARVEYRLGPE